MLTDLKQIFHFALTRDRVLRNPLGTVNKRDVGGTHFEHDRVLTVDAMRTPDRVLTLTAIWPGALQHHRPSPNPDLATRGARVARFSRPLTVCRPDS